MSAISQIYLFYYDEAKLRPLSAINFSIHFMQKIYNKVSR